MTPEQKAAALRPLIERVRTSATATRNAAGRQAWTDVPLTAERLLAHLDGSGPARGVCPILEGESAVRATVLDFDDHAKDMDWSTMSTAVQRVAATLELAWDAQPIAWRSGGGRGVHLFIMWRDKQDAYSVMAWLDRVLEDCGFREGIGGVRAGRVEVYPKQTHVAVGKYGNQFILPWSRASVPLVYEELSGLYVERDEFTAADWLFSGPVRFVEPPVRAVHAPVDLSQGASWRQALHALMTVPKAVATLAARGPWLECLMAIHQIHEGDEAGRDVAHEFSAALPQYDPERVDKDWNSFRVRNDGVTAATILFHARKLADWVEPIDASEFGAVVPYEAPRGDADAPAGKHEPRHRGELADADIPNFDRESKGAAIKPTVTNTVLAVRVPVIAGFRVAWDEFRDEITVAAPATDEWRPFEDPDAVRIRMELEREGFKAAGKEQVRDAVVLVASENRYDSAQLWLRGCVARWDGVRRVDAFMVRYLGVADSPYARAVGRYVWTALAGRVLEPGCQADMVPILEGDQGLRKSSAIAALSPAPEFFVEVDLEEDEEKTVRKMRGTLVAELAELSGLHTRALEAIKKYVTRRTEKWVPKYKEFPSTFKRRVVHFGTTNRTDILADETGERRWLPVHIEFTDVEAIERDREQLWAEGALMFAGDLCAETPGIPRPLGGRFSVGAQGLAVWSGGGVAWEDAERLAVSSNAHAAFTVDDTWSDAIGAWLDAVDEMAADGRPAGAANGSIPFALCDVMTGALGIGIREQGPREQKRASAILKRMGFDRVNRRRGGRQGKMWVACSK